MFDPILEFGKMAYLSGQLIDVVKRVGDIQYDVFIIGGGINGCGIARDASGRGLRIGLAEQGDLAQGTSSASTKLIHGGLRYLEHFEFRLVREALQEREKLLSIAPHIIQPMRFVLPHLPGMRPKWMLWVGLFLYDRLGGRQSLPGSRAVDLRTDEAGTPLQENLTAGFEYSDCWVDDARLVVLNARDAANHGADIFTRTEVVHAARLNGGWTIDLCSDGVIRSVTARALINAAGPWADIAAERIAGGKKTRRIRLVQGAHIITRKLFDHDRAYIFQNQDRRIIFAIPYENDFTLIGTTDTEFSGDPGTAKLQAQEARYLTDAASAYFREKIQTSDIKSSYAGVRALAGADDGDAQAASRDYELEIESEDDLAPVLSVLGGKITSYRALAEEALEKLSGFLTDQLQAPNKGAWTGKKALPGGDMAAADLAKLASELTRQHGWLDKPTASRWVRAYGSQAGLLAQSAPNGMPGRHFGEGLHQIEVEWMIEREWARTSEDVLWRRSKLGLHLDPAQADELENFMSGRGVAAGSQNADKLI